MKDLLQFIKEDTPHDESNELWTTADLRDILRRYEDGLRQEWLAHHDKEHERKEVALQIMCSYMQAISIREPATENVIDRIIAGSFKTADRFLTYAEKSKK